MTIINKFTKKLDRLIGLECWSQMAGAGTGSIVHLDFGKKLKRKKLLKNPHLTKEQQTFEGEIILFLENCSWRIDGKDTIICSFQDDSANDGVMLKGLKQLTGEKVIDYSLSQPGLDLTIFFSNNIKLNVFCTETDEEEGGDNYTLFIDGASFTVGVKSLLLVDE